MELLLILSLTLKFTEEELTDFRGQEVEQVGNLEEITQ